MILPTFKNDVIFEDSRRVFYTPQYRRLTPTGARKQAAAEGVVPPLP